MNTATIALACLRKLEAQQALEQHESQSLFEAIATGELGEPEVRRVLMGFNIKPPSPPEIAGAISALRALARPFPSPTHLFADSCGTGGDGVQSVNISTAVAFVAAAAGLPVAKHGNRSSSSKCGSADVLEALGVRLDPDPRVARRCLDEAGVCFLFAPHYHGGLAHATAARRALKTRTIMNILGPLLNPSRPPIQITGVYDESLLTLTAQSLRLSGCRSALVVHGAGLDELALHAPSRCALLHEGVIEFMEIDPRELGLKPAPREALVGGNAADNALWLRNLVAGQCSDAHRDAVALNAGALLWTADPSTSLRSCVNQAVHIIEEGRAQRTLHALVEQSHASLETIAAPMGVIQ